MGEPAIQAFGGGVETLHTSVATLCSNLVTRPTGRAVRLAIERQIEGARGPCLSILDFSQVGVLDFSCADEVVAKLLRRYLGRDRPAEAYFAARGVSEHHKEPIEAVLRRHNLLLVVLEEDRSELWGPAPPRIRWAWDSLGQLGRAVTRDIASARSLTVTTAHAWLRRLAQRRVAVPEGRECFSSLAAMLERRAPITSAPIGVGPYRVAAERRAPYTLDSAARPTPAELGRLAEPSRGLDPRAQL